MTGFFPVAGNNPVMSHAEHLADLDLHPNEASGLLRVDHGPLLRRHGWDRGFWTVLDEPAVTDGIALIGHAAGETPRAGWTIRHAPARRTDGGGDARDAESLARHDGWVYIFGSHHGGKQGPLRRREQWVARFRESDVADAPPLALHVVHDEFRLHRLVNDALRDCGVPLVQMRPETRRGFVDPVVDSLAGTTAQGRVRPDDWALNIEGVTFAPDGAVIAGLRFPVTVAGEPLLVWLDDVAGMFADEPRWPEVTAVRPVAAIGRNGAMAGVRDLTLADGVLHVVTGDLDSAGKGSVIRKEYPEGDQTVSTHWRVPLDGTPRGATLAAEPVREFPDHPRIEGIAPDRDGAFFYVSDSDEAVSLHATPLLTGT